MFENDLELGFHGRHLFIFCFFKIDGRVESPILTNIFKSFLASQAKPVLKVYSSNRLSESLRYLKPFLRVSLSHRPSICRHSFFSVACKFPLSLNDLLIVILISALPPMHSFTMRECEKRNMKLAPPPLAINSLPSIVLFLSHKKMKKSWTFYLGRNQPEIYIEAKGSGWF